MGSTPHSCERGWGNREATAWEEISIAEDTDLIQVIECTSWRRYKALRGLSARQVQSWGGLIPGWDGGAGSEEWLGSDTLLPSAEACPPGLPAAHWCLQPGHREDGGLIPNSRVRVAWTEGARPVLSKGSKCLALTPFPGLLLTSGHPLPGLGCHPRVGRGHPKVTETQWIRLP